MRQNLEAETPVGLGYAARMIWSRQDLVMAVCAAVSLGALGACDRPEGPSTNGGPAPATSTSTGAATTAAAVTRAVIRMDPGHDAMTVKDAPSYVIAPAAELDLEVGDYVFPRRDAGPAAPDAVHVVHGSAGYHRASFSGKRVALNTGSLDAVKGGPFQGFEAGESYLIAVGAEAPSADGAMRFTPLWTGRVSVAPR